MEINTPCTLLDSQMMMNWLNNRLEKHVELLIDWCDR